MEEPPASKGELRSGVGKNLKRRLEDRADNASRLLAQAVQTSEREAKLAREKKKQRKNKEGWEQLLSGNKKKKKKKKKKQKKKKKKRDREKRRRRHQGADDEEGGGEQRIKPDPGGDPGSSESSEDEESSSSGRDHRRRKDSNEDSDLSYEQKSDEGARQCHGHAGEELPRTRWIRGELLENEGNQPGVKISTYFALLIRPYPEQQSVDYRSASERQASGDSGRSGKPVHSCAYSPLGRGLEHGSTAQAPPAGAGAISDSRHHAPGPTPLSASCRRAKASHQGGGGCRRGGVARALGAGPTRERRAKRRVAGKERARVRTRMHLGQRRGKQINGRTIRTRG